MSNAPQWKQHLKRSFGIGFIAALFTMFRYSRENQEEGLEESLKGYFYAFCELIDAPEKWKPFVTYSDLETYKQQFHNGCLVLLVIFVFAFLAYRIMYLRQFGRKKILRGSETKSRPCINRMVDEADKKLPEEYKKNYLMIGDIKIPITKETSHLFLNGITGSGKSTTIFHLIKIIRERGQRLLILDPSSEYLCRFYKEGDTVFNPFDERFPGWSIFNEMRNLNDALDLAKSIIPDGYGEQQHWNHHAQTLVKAVLESMYLKGEKDMKMFMDILTAPKADLAEHLQGTPAMALLDEGAEKMLGSIRAIISTHVQPYYRIPSGSFSIKNWVEKESSSCFFLPYLDNQIQSLQPVLATWLSIAISQILSLTPNDYRRVWFILDEISSIGKIQGIDALATRARKHGGSAVVGLQSIAQLRERYTHDGAQSILSCLSNVVTLRCSDAETAEEMSKQIGDQEFMVKQASGSGFEKDNWTEHVGISRMLLPSEIQKIPDLCGYVSLAGKIPVTPFKLKYYEGPKDLAERFLPRKSRRGRRANA